MNTLQISLLSIGILFAVMVLVIFIISWIVAFKTANQKTYTKEQILEEDIKGVSTIFDLKKYIEKGPLSYETLKTVKGTKVEYEIWGKKSNDKFVILIHGISNGKERMYKYAKVWNDLGYNAIAFDGRGWKTGTEVGRCTFGYKESDLVQEIYLDIVDKFSTKHVGIHGESMGGATVFNWIKKYQKFTPIKFAVEESGYFDFLHPAIVGMERRNVPKFLAYVFLPFVKLWLLTFGINLWKVKVNKKHVKNWFNLPILLMHSKTDRIVPWVEYERIKKILIEANVDFDSLEIEDSRHVRTLNDVKYQQEWIESLKRFVEKVNNEQ